MRMWNSIYLSQDRDQCKPCEHEYEPLGFLKYGEFHDYLNDY
jgi:hypothetical protein